MAFGAINDAHSEQYFKISLTIGRARRVERTIEPAQKKARQRFCFGSFVSFECLKSSWMKTDWDNFFSGNQLRISRTEHWPYGCSEKVQQRNNIEWNPVSFCPLHLISYQILLSIYESEADIPEYSRRGFIWNPASSLFTSPKCWFLGFIWRVIFKN